MKMVKLVRWVMGALLIVIALILFSCASSKPALYQNGEPLSIVEYEKIAQKEYENGKYDNAIATYQVLIKNYPSHKSAVAWATYEIGYCYYQKKQYAKAQEYFRKVVNEFSEPAAKKLAQEMLTRIGEAKK